MEGLDGPIRVSDDVTELTRCERWCENESDDRLQLADRSPGVGRLHQVTWVTVCRAVTLGHLGHRVSYGHVRSPGSSGVRRSCQVT